MHKSTVVAFRLVTDDYWAPLGVWVVREAVKKAMLSKPLKFNSSDELVNYAVTYAKKQFNYDLTPHVKSSELLRQAGTQKKIADF